MTRQDFQVLSAGTDLIEWGTPRRIRATFASKAQMLYRLKSNSFSLWNWANNDMSCPHLGCDRNIFIPSSHVFWSCPGAQRHWNHLFRCSSVSKNSDEAGLHLWVLEWSFLEHREQLGTRFRLFLGPIEDPSSAKDAIFPAGCELRRFVVASTLHAIWIERLRLTEDSTLSNDTHTTGARANVRRAITRLRNSTFQSDAGDEGIHIATARSALANTLLRYDVPPSLRPLQSDDRAGFFYLLFFHSGSFGNPGPGRSGSVIIQVNIPTHAASSLWVASMAYGHPSTSNNIAEYQGLVHGLRQASACGYSPLCSQV